MFLGNAIVAPQPAFAQGATAPGMDVCAGCHEDQVKTFKASKHGTKADPRTPASVGACSTCHGDGTAHVKAGGGKGVGGMVNPGPRNASMSAEAKSGICLTCHQGGKRVHWDRSAHASSEVACSSCHQVHTAHDKARDKLTQAETCFACHKEQRAQFNRPSRHPIKEGKVACSDCHNPHGSAGPTLMVRDSVNDTCYQCHMEKRGPFARTHEPVQEDCSICHNPHGTTNPNLLKLRSPFLCQSCHQSVTHRAFVPLDGPAGAAPTLNQGIIMARGCVNCHTSIHGSNNPSDAAGGSGRGFRR